MNRLTRYHTQEEWIIVQGTGIPREPELNQGRTTVYAPSRALNEPPITEKYGIKQPILTWGQASGSWVCCGRNVSLAGCWVTLRSRETLPVPYEPFRDFKADGPDTLWKKQLGQYLKRSNPNNVRGTMWIPGEMEEELTSRGQPITQYYDDLHASIMKLRPTVGLTLLAIAKREPVTTAQLNGAATMYSLVGRYNDAQEPFKTDRPSWWKPNSAAQWLRFLQKQAYVHLPAKPYQTASTLASNSVEDLVNSTRAPFSATLSTPIKLGPKGWDIASAAVKAERMEAAVKERLLSFEKETEEASEDLYFRQYTILSTMQLVDGLWDEWKMFRENWEQQKRYSALIGRALHMFLLQIQERDKEATWSTYFPSWEDLFGDVDAEKLKSLAWSSTMRENVTTINAKMESQVDAMFEKALQTASVRYRREIEPKSTQPVFDTNTIDIMRQLSPLELLISMINTWSTFRNALTTPKEQDRLSQIFIYQLLTYFSNVGGAKFNQQWDGLERLFTQRTNKDLIDMDDLVRTRFRLIEETGTVTPSKDEQMEFAPTNLTVDEANQIGQRLDLLIQQTKAERDQLITDRSYTEQSDLLNRMLQEWIDFVQAPTVKLEFRPSRSFILSLAAFIEKSVGGVWSDNQLPTLRGILQKYIYDREKLLTVQFTKYPDEVIPYRPEDRISINQSQALQIEGDIRAMLSPSYYEEEEEEEGEEFMESNDYTYMVDDDDDETESGEMDISVSPRQQVQLYDASELEALFARLKFIQQDNKSFKDLIANAEKSLQVAKNKRADMTNLQITLKSANDELGAAKRRFNEIKKLVKRDIRAKEREKVNAENRLKDLEKQLERVNRDVTQLQANSSNVAPVVITIAKERQSNLTARVKDAKEKASEAKKAYDAALKEMRSAKGAYQQREKAVDTLRSKVRDTEAKLQQAVLSVIQADKDVITAMEALADSAELKRKEFSAEYATMLDALNRTFEAFQSDTSALEEEVKRLQNQLEVLEARDEPQFFPPESMQTSPRPFNGDDDDDDNDGGGGGPFPPFGGLPRQQPPFSVPPSPPPPPMQQARDVVTERLSVLRDLLNTLYAGTGSPSAVQELRQRDVELQQRFNDLQASFNEGKRQYDELKRAYDEKVAQNERLVAQVRQGAAPVSQVKESGEEVAALQKELDELKDAAKTAETLQRQNTQKDARIEKLEMDLKQCEIDRKKLQTELNRMAQGPSQIQKDTLQQLQEKESTLQNKIRELTGTNSKLVLQLENAKAKNVNLAKDVASVKDQRDEYKAKVEELQGKAGKADQVLLQQLLDKLAGVSEDDRGALDELMASYEGILAVLGDAGAIGTILERAQRRLADAKAVLDQQDVYFDNFEKKTKEIISAAEETLKQQAAQIESLQKQLQSAESGVKKEIEEKEEEESLSELRQKLALVEEVRDNFQKQVNQLKKDNKTLERDLKRALQPGRADELQKALQQKNAEVERLNQEVGRLTEEVAAMERTQDDVQQLKAGKAALIVQRAQQQKLIEELRGAVAQFNEKNEEMQQLRQTIVDQAAELEDLRNQLSSAAAPNPNLQKLVIDLSQRQIELQAAKETLEQEQNFRKRLLGEIRALETALGETQEKFQDTLLENLTLKRDLEQYTASLSDLSRRYEILQREGSSRRPKRKERDRPIPDSNAMEEEGNSEEDERSEKTIKVDEPPVGISACVVLENGSVVSL